MSEVMTPIGRLRDALNASLIEREAEVDAILLGLVAREHVLLVGPPGTAKSHLCRSVADGIEGCRYVERLMSPTTPPEAVFGPISLAALREDRYEHVTAGTVADAELVFLDEFFRGSDSIRDTLLHLLGPERQALIGTRQVKVPMLSCVGAANSWAESADQQAIMDRWLIRRTVKPVSPSGRERLLFDVLPTFSRTPITAYESQPLSQKSIDRQLASGLPEEAVIREGKLPVITGYNPPTMPPACTLADIVAAGDLAAGMPFSGAARTALTTIFEELAAAGIRPSDRRCRQSLKVARAAAVIAGHSEVMPADLEPLGDVLWDQPGDQADKAADIVTRIANPAGQAINRLMGELDEVTRSAVDQGSRGAALKKIEAMEREASGLLGTGNGRAKKLVALLRNERATIAGALAGVPAEIMMKMLPPV